MGNGALGIGNWELVIGSNVRFFHYLLPITHSPLPITHAQLKTDAVWRYHNPVHNRRPER
ncbi:hypothetical protein NIES4075_61670 [Tolypothrix sp. NIES-4075]|nr:hypothetical protein NIES4075_61670 [Tolypothrix sp. NIES-4075]